MYITFVIPPSPFLLDERVFPSLGVLKVAASARLMGHGVRVLDLSGVSDCEPVVMLHARSWPVDAWALTATTPQMPSALRIANIIREESPDAKIILGGPHATLVHAASKAERKRAVHGGRAGRALQALVKGFTTVVAGDGERAVSEALDQRHTLVDADDPRSPLWLTSQGFTDSPWPARDLIQLDTYRYEIDGERAMHIVAQLGCPYECGFCGGRESYMLRRVRLRTTASVIAEMEHLHTTYGVRAMMLNDDELNVNKQMIPLMNAIHDLGERHGFTWRLRGFVKSELFTPEQAGALVHAGFRWVLCGFEAAHPRILRNINKKATLEDNTRMLRTAHAHGLKVKALMSIGHPGESEESVLAVRDWLLAERPDDFDVTVITTYPGTPHWDHAVHVGEDVYRYEYNGDVLYMRDIDFTVDAAFYKGMPGEYKSFVWTDHLSAERLCALRDAVEYEVRSRLGIPYPAAPARSIERTMGQ